jgi:hypothetical protein
MNEITRLKQQSMYSGKLDCAARSKYSSDNSGRRGSVQEGLQGAPVSYLKHLTDFDEI